MNSLLLSVMSQCKKRKATILFSLFLVLTIFAHLIIAANTNKNGIVNNSDSLKNNPSVNTSYENKLNNDVKATSEAITTQIGAINTQTIADIQEVAIYKKPNYTPDELNYLCSETEKSISPYAHLGVSVDTDTSLMMYNGQYVREILDWNPTTGAMALITKSLGPKGFDGWNISGGVDLAVVYEENVMVGLEVSTQDEYDMRTEERRSFIADNY